MKNMDGMSESEIAHKAKQIIEEKGRMRISKLIDEMERAYPPSGQDADIITGRTDTYFSQKIRNLVSHRKSDDTIHGILKYIPDENGNNNGYMDII
ncbi:MAG: hypothetical protein IJ846_01515 [Alphaproteobacteria bacterium]|nr:hypothetical protein [Alphaproteobacteria bacterium]